MYHHLYESLALKALRTFFEKQVNAEPFKITFITIMEEMFPSTKQGINKKLVSWNPKDFLP